MDPTAATSVDEYIAQVASADARKTLSRLREIIREEVPEAVEVISYGIPSYKFNKTMVSFAAFKKHCSFFPGYTVGKFLDELKGYKTSKGTLQFPSTELPPEDLIRRILRERFWPTD